MLGSDEANPRLRTSRGRRPLPVSRSMKPHLVLAGNLPATLAKCGNAGVTVGGCWAHSRSTSGMNCRRAMADYKAGTVGFG